jgi:hypothetical protein
VLKESGGNGESVRPSSSSVLLLEWHRDSVAVVKESGGEGEWW